MTFRPAVLAVLTLPLLAAAPAAKKPAPVLEPTPDAGFNRIQPRNVTASSFLKNGWNAYEQNYLPQYIADDDAATAWVEGVDGTGAGQFLLWVGPELEEVEAFQVFIRNGYQKSQALYAANARPRRVKVIPVVMEYKFDSVATPAAEVVERELEDVVGWQRIDVPVGGKKAGGIRLEIASTRDGTKYSDTCISDLRVYVKGKDRYVAAAENRAADAIRAFVSERAKAAKAEGRPHVSFEPAYVAATPWSVELYSDDRPENTEEEGETLHDAKKALELAMRRAGARTETKGWLERGLERINAAESISDKSWSTVKVASRASAPNALVAFKDLALGKSRLATRSGYLHRKDFGAFQDSNADSGKLLDAAKILSGLTASNAKTCLADCNRTLKGLARRDVADPANACPELCGPKDAYQLPWVDLLRAHAAAKVEVDGPLDTFKRMRRVDVTDVGRREFTLGTSEEMIWYDGDLADTLYVLDRQNSSEDTVVNFFEWDKKASPARLLSVTEVRTALSWEPAERTVTVATYRAEVATAAATTPPTKP